MSRKKTCVRVLSATKENRVTKKMAFGQYIKDEPRYHPSVKSTLRQYVTEGPIFTPYTREEQQLLRYISQPHYLARLNRILARHMGVDRAPLYSSETLRPFFEGYVSEQWPDIDPNPDAFTQYVISNAQPIRTHRLTDAQRGRAFKIPYYKEIANYPEVVDSKHDDLPLLEPR